MPATLHSILHCGDMAGEGKSAVCLNCHAQYNHQKNGDVESIPLSGSSEAAKAEEDLFEATATENRIIRFVREHPFMAAGLGAAFALGVIGVAIGGYKASQSGKHSASTQVNPEQPTAKPAVPSATIVPSMNHSIAARPTANQPSAKVPQVTPKQPKPEVDGKAPSVVTPRPVPTISAPAKPKPAPDKPVTEKPAANKPAPDRPATEKPATPKQTTLNYEGVKQINLLVDNRLTVGLQATYKVDKHRGRHYLNMPTSIGTGILIMPVPMLCPYAFNNDSLNF